VSGIEVPSGPGMGLEERDNVIINVCER